VSAATESRDDRSAAKVLWVIRWHLSGLYRLVSNHKGGRRAAARYYSYWLLRQLTPHASVRNGDMTFLVHTADDVVGRFVYCYGNFEPEFMERAVALITAYSGRTLAGTTFVDVGANIGTSTVSALRLLGCDRAVCFEPSPDNVRVLNANLALNDLLDRAIVVPAVVSSGRGTAELEISTTNSGDHRVRADGSTRAAATVTVEAADLDGSLARLGVGLERVGLVWIDTQGHEGHVLQGAAEVLRAGVPIVLEYWPQRLKQAGGHEPLRQTLIGTGRQLVDLRTPDARPEAAAPLLDRLDRELLGPQDQTDLLVLSSRARPVSGLRCAGRSNRR
jgi:FkbM family methyltransferase